MKPPCPHSSGEALDPTRSARAGFERKHPPPLSDLLRKPAETLACSFLIVKKRSFKQGELPPLFLNFQKLTPQNALFPMESVSYGRSNPVLVVLADIRHAKTNNELTTKQSVQGVKGCLAHEKRFCKNGHQTVFRERS